ncbi:MAG: RdgB/HAM1 family non-canonical purine NTP pyrophosphatase [Candidatus Eremiobacteraeota bacterium]|nr:RdgB/HAM1 family non-canonical purine NTP pyrophosphatase [Candidatus Eremiobacteraeota bacterium]
MKTFVATKNLGKLDELKAIFRDSPLELDTYPLYQDVEEGDESYAQNAALKARALAEQLRQGGIRAAVLADDSGLEVFALDGRPGVLSARYAGKEATWPERRARLLEELRDVPDDKRGAKFCCAIMLVTDDGREIPGYGEVEGTITREERGRFGFGFDPIFNYEHANKSFAELAEEEKNRVSHRRRAADILLENLNVG